MALFSTNHTLTQGSLHYRLATLGYQKQNPYGVHQFYKKTLRPLFLLKWLSKTEGYGVPQFYKKTLRPLFLLKWLSKAEGDGVRIFHKFCKKTLPASPLSLERGWG